MLWTGLRYCDLVYLEIDCIAIEERGLRVDITRTKAIRSEILRTELFIPNRIWPDGIFEAFVKSAIDWISCRRTSTIAPPGTNASSLNDYLDEAWMSLGIPGRHPTTYTFRRAAFHRFIEDSKRTNGYVNWTKVSALSLHMNEKTVKAFYHLGVGKKKRSI